MNVTPGQARNLSASGPGPRKHRHEDKLETSGQSRNKRIIHNRKRRRKRPPESGGRWEETVTAPTNPRATNLHTALVRRGRLASATRPQRRGRDSTRQLIRATVELI
ncbi:hypothetical protein SK128_013383 [Halocaridina rubra]|uniref:Uncharacterized protein n=1 Tax=Halocaridina rubra TaxID=373956 RepID=A0AAN8XJ14_HALRR